MSKFARIFFFAILGLSAGGAYAIGTCAPYTGCRAHCTATKCYSGCTVCDRGPTGSCHNDPACHGI